VSSSPYWITGFADEISPDLSVQIKTFVDLELQAIDLRSVNNVNVLKLSDDDLKQVGDACEAAGLKVQTIASPVNKVDYTPENQLEELAKLKQAIHACELLGVKRIRLFTPETHNPEDEAGVIAWMREQRTVAEDHDVVLIHENDAKYWGAYPAQAQRLFEALANDHFKAAFDFANTVLLGYKPYDDWFPWIVPYLDTLHIKDAFHAEHKIVPAGEGEGQIEQTLKFLFDQGWSGPLTIEPHLQAAGHLGGFSGPELFTVATKALRSVLEKVKS
jgi:sugar phosphate isomerase/epimerase